jgi:ABC-2 type transport system ATP-binding protein
MPPGLPVVSVEGLWKRYGRHPAVADVSFEVNDREVLGLLGPNGSGKTTILRILTGYLRPTAGTIRVGGVDIVENGHEARKRIGYVQEHAPLYGHMRVREFLAFMGQLRGMPDALLQRRIDDACERLALHSVGDAVIGRLSHGYRKRVSIAQAILHAPQLLVLDEPTNGLDPRQIIELRGLLEALARDCAVLVTSHILAEMERVADRVAILLDGRLLTVHRLPRGAQGAALRLRAPAAAAEAVAAVLAAIPGIARLTAEAPDGDSRSWRLDTTDADAATGLATRLCAAGIASVERLEAASDLEALFLRLTASKAVH